MSAFTVGARLQFPLPDVLAAAEHAAAATEHRTTYGQTISAAALWWVKDDGTYLMSNGVHVDGTTEEARARTVVHAEGWGSGTDARSVCGGDDFVETLPLRDPSWTEDGTAFLDVLRAAVRAGHAWLILEISTDRQRFGITTEPDRSRVTASNTADPTGLRVPMRVTVTDDAFYPAIVDVTERWNGWLSPHLTLDTVRQLAADTQADARRYGRGEVDTVHVIDGGEDENGNAEVIVVHVRWTHYADEGARCASIVAPGADGLYCIGGWEWTWHAADPARPAVSEESPQQE